MSQFIADLLIWILLAAGTGFGILGFFGLLIFPDIRSRLFTASRATLIGTSLVTISVIIFAILGFTGGRGDRYATLAIHTIFLYGILVIGYVLITRIILEQVPAAICPMENSALTEMEKSS